METSTFNRESSLFELHGAALDGVPDHVKLHPPLQAGETLSPGEVTRDGRWVHFTISGTNFFAPSDGQAPPVALLPTGANFGGTTLDSQRALFFTAEGLFSMPLDGSAGPVRLSEPLASGERIHFPTSQGGSQILYLVRPPNGASPTFLWSAPVDGSRPAAPLASIQGNLGLSRPPLISRDGAQAVFFDDRDADGNIELYGVPTDGGSAAVRLHGAPVPGGGVESCRIAANSLLVVFRADLETDGEFELFRTPIDGSLPAAKIPLPGTGVNIPRYELSPDSTRLVFLANLDTATSLELYSMPIDGSQLPTKLNAALAPGDDVSLNDAFTISADSSGVLFVARELTTGAEHLFRAPLAGGSPPLQLSRDLQPGGFFVDYRVSADGRWAAYRNQNSQLFVVPTDGSAAAQRVHEVGQVTTYELSPDSRRVAFLGDLERPGVFELFQFRLTRPLQRTR